MSSGLRSLVQQKITQSVQNTNLSLSDIHSNLLSKYASGGTFSFSLPLKTKQYDIQSDAEEIAGNSHDSFSNVTLRTEGHPSLNFEIPRDTLVKDILESNIQGLSPPRILPKKQSIVIDFSSPNIAKPVHVGHLRSTIIGNYLANLHSYLGNGVKKISYLGDWGTQFGYVQLGIDLLKISDDVMKTDPILELYKAYVHANKLAKNDPSIADRARDIFENLENGDPGISEKWQIFRKYTTEELEKIYGRLGFSFDEYHWESMYRSREIGDVISQMDRLNLLKTDAEERKVFALNDDRNIPILKSDGSTLYLTRDIAAAIDRYERYKFDRMYYVVDNGQTDHFANLASILERMNLPWANRLRHVKFGKIRGMSTRGGTAVFLSDFLNEARDTMKKRQERTSTTKVSLGVDDNSSDILGMSAVIIHDLRQKRHRDYKFDWNVALNIKGETGVRLQYAHCRLVSLEENCGVSLPAECDPELLKESCVNALIAKIIQFDEAIISSYQTLEPCYLTKYLFDLCHAVNKTLQELRVEDAPNDVASQRLLLFRIARNVLAEGMKLLGLRPLQKM